MKSKETTAISYKEFQQQSKKDNSMGFRYKAMRVSRGLSVAEVAQKIHVSEDALSRFENGEESLTFEQCCTLCTVYNVTQQFGTFGINDELIEKGLL